MNPIIVLALFAIVLLGSAIFLKTNVGISTGIAALFVLFICKLPLLGFSQTAFSTLDSFPFLAVPLFILAGTIMEYSGISASLIAFIDSFVYRFRGSIGAVTVLASMAFGVLTGSVAATISSIGKMMVPPLVARGYSKGYSGALIASTCYLGILIPPSVSGIIYSLASGTNIEAVWLSTIGPGILIGIGTIITNYLIQGRKEKKIEDPFIFRDYAKGIGISFKNTLPALIMPILIFGGIYGGFTTPTEAGAISVIYGLVYFIIKTLLFRIKGKKLASLWKISASSATLTCVVGFMVVFGAAAGRSLSMANVSNTLASFVINNISSPIIFLLMVNVLLLFMGCIIDINANIMIMVPLLMPSVTALGIDPIHFAAITLLNLCIGFITPPVAGGIWMACKIADADFVDIIKNIWPFLIVGFVALVITTCAPKFVLFFPNLFS